MKDYMLFYECVKKANLCNVINFTSKSMLRSEKVISFLKFMISILFLVGSDLEIQEISKLISFFFGVVMLAYFTYSFIQTLQRRVVKCMGIFDPRVKGDFLTFRYIKFLIFVKYCDENSLLNKDKARKTVDCCEKELAQKNYSFISSHPMFIIYASTMSAALVVFFDNKEILNDYFIFYLVAITYFVWLFVLSKLSYIKKFHRTKQLCQWLDYFDDNDLRNMVDAMRDNKLKEY
ncbi:MAG: hypothetical protein ACPGUE_16035 [Marinomonas sp.]